MWFPHSAYSNTRNGICENAWWGWNSKSYLEWLCRAAREDCWAAELSGTVVRFLTCFSINCFTLKCSVIVSNCSVPFVWRGKKNPTNHNEPGCIKTVPLHSLKSYSLFQSYLFLPPGNWCVNIWGCSFMLFSASWVLWMISLKEIQNIIYKFLMSFEAIS